ncbi:DODA-type extradiol aromatic ring-opening family dioxygenase [Paenibacillus ehimensis]|uniref:Class III extradiol ring-cleavage dioxygenase n=1 Tax=Paenibacillus ehimensis TaxID=79264 RepID=A0ABT8V721_9BACL|nr:class III extradiol ring-cleavage dioxygenase [Paenibacillus ehimensis]MDO3677233.1 class III extradiol ring-cleavage dioxygenase [Paenibacillus ehimensis]MEC0210721.1 class III extradiol ring-cleavage dioxygenase [Paenibacillus ehimensis]
MIPALFLAHGSPMLAIEQTPYTDFLAKLGERYEPRAIVIFTAHWESETLTISSTDDVYDTIYDFGGFPDELYQVKYPARGSKAIAAMLEQKLTANGIEVRTDSVRGLDHGAWTLLHRMYPKADIPVVQVSVNPYLAPERQYRIGEAIRGLGRQGILVIGSGVTVHNLRMVNWGQKTPEPWAVSFDDWLLEKLQSGDLNALFHYAEQAPYARQAVPRAEHFVPLFIAMGSGEGEAQMIHRSYDLGTLSYMCLQF